MRKYYVLSAVGSNRPGVVAEISELIYHCRGNIDDSRMSLLGNHFTLQILLSGEEEGISEELREGCGVLQKEKGVAAFLFPVGTVGHAPPAEEAQPNYEIRVIGLDRAGIVYRTSSLLASRKINIVDLETHVSVAPESGGQVFTMTSHVVVPVEIDGKELREDLEELADELNVEISLTRLTF